MNEHRGNLYLLTGLIFGLVVGVIVAWYVLPVQFVDIGPSLLEEPYQDEYRRTVALAYEANGNLERARERLKQLYSSDDTERQDLIFASKELAAQAQRMLAENGPVKEARALAILAADLGRPVDITTPEPSPPAEEIQTLAPSTSASPIVEDTLPPATAAVETSETSPAAVQTATPTIPTQTPTPTLTPRPTITPRPTMTPVNLDSPFILESQEEVCDGTIPVGLLQVYVYDEKENPLPGVQVTISWEGGEDVFYTGLAPEISPGYGDYMMNDGVKYTLKLGKASQTITDIAANETCGLLFNFFQTKDN